MWGTVSSTDRVTQSYCTNKALIQPRFRVYWLMFSERMYCIMPITQPVQMVWQEWLCLLHCMVTHHNSSSTICLSTTSFFLLRDSIKLIAINQKSWIQFWINRIIKWSRDVVIKNCTKYQPPETVIINAGSKRSPISLLITVVLPTLLSPINTTFSVKGIVNFLIFIYILMKYFFIQSCNIVGYILRFLPCSFFREIPRKLTCPPKWFFLLPYGRDFFRNTQLFGKYQIS